MRGMTAGSVEVTSDGTVRGMVGGAAFSWNSTFDGDKRRCGGSRCEPR